MRPAVVMIIVGGVLMVAGLVSGGVRHERDMERVAEFYKGRPTPSGFGYSSLPADLRPPVTSLAELSAMGAGGLLLLVGIIRSRERRSVAEPLPFSPT
jgi:hypothetical protein